MFAVELFTSLRVTGVRESRSRPVPDGGGRAVQPLGAINLASPTDADCSPSIIITSRAPRGAGLGTFVHWRSDMFNRHRTVRVFVAILGVLTCTGSVLGGGGNVLSSSAHPKGYSLSEIAVDTAVYNTGSSSGNPDTPPPPDVPFEILVPSSGSYTVKPGTMLYLPVFFADDTDLLYPGFPADITDHAADAAYLDSYVFANYNVTSFIVQVDGETTVLDDHFIRGVTTAPLLDGTPGGTHYIVCAAFLTPLSPGEHTVSIGGIIDGSPVTFISYNVTVSH
jgi:hypothetical protein